MSGQPVKTPADENRFRNEYMETLALQEAINDMNLQANKTYLLTGQLPPQSQMQDTRTNAEKLADVEKMKRDIADTLKPIAEPQFAYAIVNKIIENPLNLNNSLLRFLAQRADSIVEQLKKLIRVGIAGDANDLEQIVSYIVDMYAKQQGSFQSVKSYMNSLSSETMGSSRIIGANDLDQIILQLQDIIKNLHILSGGNAFYSDKIGNLIAQLSILRNVLLTSEETKIFLDYISAPTGASKIPEYYVKIYFDFLEDLPKYSQVIALINKIKKFILTNNRRLAIEGMDRLNNLFKGVLELQSSGLLTKFERLKKDISSMILKTPQGKYIETPKERLEVAKQKNNIIYDKLKEFFTVGEQSLTNMGGTFEPTNQYEYDIEKTIENTSNPVVPHPKTPSLIPNPNIGSEIGPGGGGPVYIPITSQTISQVTNELERDEDIKAHVDYLTEPQFENLIEYIGKKDVKTKEQLKKYLIAAKKYKIGDFTTAEGADVFGGMGIKKRRGRPRGSGIAQVEKPPTFIGFGINEINQRKLNDGILKIRRNTRTSFQDMPSKRISPTLQRIIKTVVGGGMPNYNDLSSLNEEEKEYLHKIVTRSNMEDKLSIPAPSKDQQEKDIHNFEVMKGQIMSGNDSIELVKKFKLLIRKLAKQGLLPKNDVEDIMETLFDLGY